MHTVQSSQHADKTKMVHLESCTGGSLSKLHSWQYVRVKPAAMLFNVYACDTYEN